MEVLDLGEESEDAEHTRVWHLVAERHSEYQTSHSTIHVYPSGQERFDISQKPRCTDTFSI